MKVVKNINNNVALCLDTNGKEVMAFGKGIGFGKPPYEIDLSRIERTYYNVEPRYAEMINSVSDTTLEIADKVINYAVIKLDCNLNANAIITLADHIGFAIKRFEQNMNLKLPIINDIKHLFEAEIDIGNYAVDLIYKQTGIKMPFEEAGYIALHILNSEYVNPQKPISVDEETIRDIVGIIEQQLNVSVDTNDFNYSRFVSHMHYLIKRGKNNKIIKSKNLSLYDSFVETFPEISDCVKVIGDYFFKQHSMQLSEEENLYLMMHINRLCSREDSNL